MPVDPIFLAISQETDPTCLSKMLEAIADRKKMLAKLMAASLRPGDIVKFSDKIRPTYLKDLTVEIVTVNRESATVKCPDDIRYGRFQNSRGVRLPLTLIGEKVEK